MMVYMVYKYNTTIKISRHNKRCHCEMQQENKAAGSKEEEGQVASQSGMDVSSSGVSSQPPTPSQRAPPCIFFQKGRCNRGAACSFSHEVQQSRDGAERAGLGVLSYPPPPPPVIIDIPPGSATIFSIDVECVATGSKIHIFTLFF